MRKKKAITFNLCDHDELHLAFVDRKGAVLYTISFDRAFASAGHRRTRKETGETAQAIRFTCHNRKAAIDAVTFKLAFHAKDAPRTTEAKIHEQDIKLDRPMEINIEGKDGLSLGTFRWERPGEQAQFNVDHEDDSRHSLMFFPAVKF
jgi:hypothetical protein